MRRAAVEEQNRLMVERQRQFRMAADVVTDAWMRFAEVQAVAVIGTVAKPLWKEVPRFREFRRERIEVWHECGDLDLALWWIHRSGWERCAAPPFSLCGAHARTVPASVSPIINWMSS
jgi:hypothetical protein